MFANNMTIIFCNYQTIFAKELITLTSAKSAFCILQKQTRYDLHGFLGFTTLD